MKQLMASCIGLTLACCVALTVSCQDTPAFDAPFLAQKKKSANRLESHIPFSFFFFFNFLFLHLQASAKGLEHAHGKQSDYVGDQRLVSITFR